MKSVRAWVILLLMLLSDIIVEVRMGDVVVVVVDVEVVYIHSIERMDVVVVVLVVVDVVVVYMVVLV